MQSYLKYKRYNDKKATATPLKFNDYCYILHTKANNQSRNVAFNDCIRTGPYTVAKVPSNNNYVVPRTGTRYTQTIHKSRLRLYAPNQRVPDVTVTGEDYLPDPKVKITYDDWYAQAWETEFGKVVFGKPTENETERTVTEIMEPTESNATELENEVVKTTTVENTEEDKKASDNFTSFNLEVRNILHFKF